ncbi:unnamed protein product [Periconia digitata]|uniref:DUF7905 domain-containing protein n=1 Tax=Periconia digitata TaxID=1303443 RepID=A0A9W4U1X2_9PLEO|nr:unnamed protein product [Periconia digitata]
MDGDESPQATGPSIFSGRKPIRVIVVPSSQQRESARAERDRLILKWKTEYNCDVRILNSAGVVTKFEIFGSGSGVNKTHQEINTWIRRPDPKSVHSAAWAKLPAYDENKWYDEQLRERDALRKQAFKGEPPKNVPFVRVVEWPSDLRENDPPILPKDVFGTKLEGLDDIRLDEEVWITPCKQPLWAVQFQSFSEAHVVAAMERYTRLILKIQNQSYGNLESLNLVLDAHEGGQVFLHEAPGWSPDRLNTITPRIIKDALLAEPETIDDSDDITRIQKALRISLDAIIYDRAHYDFSIRHGLFVLRSSNKMNPKIEIGKTYSTEQCIKFLKETEACDTKRWLADDEKGKKLLTRMMAATDFLELTRSTGFFGFASSAPADARPLIRGTYIFQENENTVLVQIDWTDDDDEGVRSYEKMEPRYFKMRKDEAIHREHMDIKLIELAESKAWQFSLISFIPMLDRRLVSPALSSFAASVQMKQGYDLASSLPPLESTKPDRTLKPIAVKIEKKYTFRIKGSGYKVDMVGRWYRQKPGFLPCCWGIDVRHSDWETHLTQMERLESGHAAQWGDPLATFFPDNGFSAPPIEDEASLNYVSPVEPPREGIRLLVDILMRLSSFVNAAGESIEMEDEQSEESDQGGIDIWNE